MMLRNALVGAMVLLLAACATAKQNLTVAGGPVAVGHTANQVEAAIEAGLKGHNWVETGKQPGRITATVSGGGKAHASATVAIVYSATGYSIEYVDSTGLSYNDKSGAIHKTYKRWVANLKADIDTHMN